MSNIFNIKNSNPMNRGTINICDTKCLREKKLNQLEQTYYRTKNNLQAAPNQFENARKEYLTFKYGLSGYNKVLENEYKKEAEIEKNILQTNFDDEYNKISSNITQLGELESYANTQTSNTSYIKYFLDDEEGFDNLNQPEEQLIKRNLTNQITLNSRKSYYELEGYNSLRFFYRYYFIFYYIFFIILCILFIKKNDLSYYKKFFILLILAFFPYYIPYVVNFHINFLKKMFNKLPIYMYSNM
jgi:hypothetical protein